ncbi:hypothetical protein BH10PAT1_BH10PAT1_2520 [soil metagenome]
MEILNKVTSSVLGKVKNINPKYRKYILAVILIIIIIFAGSKILGSKNKPTTTVATANTPQKSQNINKEFTFPVGTSATGSVINMNFTVQDASLNNQIVVQGQNATAVKGRTFLIVTLKIANNFNQSIQINTRDYVRLSVNGDENTWLAPDIHNDPVEVQAISTKYTRVGFAVNTTDKKFVLQIGEIKGDKQKITLSL